MAIFPIINLYVPSMIELVTFSHINYTGLHAQSSSRNPYEEQSKPKTIHCVLAESNYAFIVSRRPNVAVGVTIPADLELKCPRQTTESIQG